MTRDPARYGFALLAALPAIALFALDAYYTIPDFTDECLRWDANETQPMPTEGPCVGRASATSENKSEALLRFVVIEGLVLVGVTLGVLGLLVQRFWLAICGGVLLVLVSIPLLLGAAGLLPLGSGAMVLGFAYWTRSRVRIPPPPPVPKLPRGAASPKSRRR